MKRLLLATLTCCITWLSTSASGSNMGFLYDSPIRHLSTEDWKLIDEKTGMVLTSYPLRKKATWKNPESQHEGYLMALNKTHKDHLECKEVLFYTDTAYGSSQYKFNFCQYPHIGWKIYSGK